MLAVLIENFFTNTNYVNTSIKHFGKKRKKKRVERVYIPYVYAFIPHYI